jgi:hypothetical protein
MRIKLTAAAAVVPLTVLLLSACVPAQQYNALENDYNQLNQQLSGEISQQQVHITRLQIRWFMPMAHPLLKARREPFSSTISGSSRITPSRCTIGTLQQRVGCEERSDDDRRNEGIAKAETKQRSEEQWYGVVKRPKMIDRV